jgi:hypothetical protein
MQQGESLWPPTLGKINVLPPVQILAEQAQHFNSMMQNVLVAKVTSYQEAKYAPGSVGNNVIGSVHVGNELRYRLQVHVPSLKYVLDVLTLIPHSTVKPYPVTLQDTIRDKAFTKLRDQESLIGTLREILSSQELNETISSLLSQIKYLSRAES